MMFHIRARTLGTLARLNDGRFKKLRECDLECLMTGYGYVLLEKKLASFIQSIGIKGIELVPAKIQDRNSESDNEDYYEMLVFEEFDSDDIGILPLELEQFFLMDKKYLFATPSLVEKLKKSEFDLEFSIGLSEFG